MTQFLRCSLAFFYSNLLRILCVNWHLKGSQKNNKAQCMEFPMFGVRSKELREEMDGAKMPLPLPLPPIDFPKIEETW